MRRVLFLVVFGLFSAGLSQAAIDEQRAVRALIGEAIGQQDDELLAHAYALKNRGTLRGVYGFYAKHTQHYADESCWQRASKAWWTALLDDNDHLGGRTEWRSDFDLKLMASKGRTIKSQGLYDGLRFGETTFYKLRR